MSILRLRNSIDEYDPFLEHRVNGLKAVFILEILCIFNLVYTVNDPYFYFFYIPLTALTAEVAGQTLTQKYQLFTYTMLGSTISIFLFGILASYKLFFIFFVFFYSLAIYSLAIYWFKSFFIPAPIIFSLSAYSLIYQSGDSSFYGALNHALQSLLALILVVSSLLFFPKIYYYRIWRKGFINVLTNLEKMCEVLIREEALNVSIIPGTLIMQRFAGMLSVRMKFYSILKINLLSLDLVMSMSYLATFQKQIKLPYIVVLHRYIALLKNACITDSELFIPTTDALILEETYDLQVLKQIIQSWNYLCRNQ